MNKLYWNFNFRDVFQKFLSSCKQHIFSTQHFHCLILGLAGHCIRHPELLANDLIKWEPEARRGETRRGRPRQSYLSTLLRDFGINTKEELRTLFRDRDILRKISAVYRTPLRLSNCILGLRIPKPIFPCPNVHLIDQLAN